MKRLYHLLFILIIILFAQESFSQCTQGGALTFQKTFIGAADENADEIERTLDGGYVVVGKTTSHGVGGLDVFITKFDQNFNVEWSNTYGGTSHEGITAVYIEQTSDSGYIVCESTNSFGAGSFNDGYVFKLNSQGVIQWEKRMQGSHIEYLRDVIETPSGNFLIVGTSNTYGAGNSDAYLVKISSVGNLIWTKTYGVPSTDHLVGIISLPNDNYMLTGNSNSFGPGLRGGFMMKVDSNGNVIWSKTFGGNNRDIFNSSILLSDGNIASIGLSDHSTPGIWDVLVTKIDTNGNVIWSKTYGGTGDEKGYQLKEHYDGGLIISGFTNSFGNGNQLLLIKTDLVGNPTISKVYGGTNEEWFDNWAFPIALSADSGIVMVGGTRSFGVGNKDFYMVKTNKCLESYCNEQDVVLTVVNQPATAVTANLNVSQGGSLINTSTSVGITSFTENYLCEDTVVFTPSCNLNANFSSLSFCLGDSTFFNDLSVDNVGVIQNWQWYFGDGDSIVGVQNPIHFYVNSGVFNVVLAVTNDSNCVDSITIPIVINPVYSLNVAGSICQGDSILMGGVFQDSNGIYTDSLQTEFGCDSLVITTLTVDPIFNTPQNQIICQGDSILLGGIFQYFNGIYTDSLQSEFGCDSLILTTLTVNPSYTLTQNQSVCQGDSVLFGGIFYNGTGNYWDSLQTVLGCDSLLMLDLAVNPFQITNSNQTICQVDSIFLGGNFQNSNGTYLDTLQSIFSCDSIISTTLVVLNNVSDSIIVNICEGESVFLAGVNQVSAGLYVDTFQTVVANCDSVVFATLIVNPIPIIVTSNDTSVLACGAVQLGVTGAVSYSWSPSDNLSCNDCSNPIFIALSTMLFTVTGIENGCSSTGDVLITVDGESELIIPNVFSPNRDGVNDGFNITGGCIISMDKQIYNRWGELVFSSKQIDEDWNGRTTTGKEAPEGTYFYIFNAEVFIDGFPTTEVFKGTVTLLR